MTSVTKSKLVEACAEAMASEVMHMPLQDLPDSQQELLRDYATAALTTQQAELRKVKDKVEEISNGSYAKRGAGAAVSRSSADVAREILSILSGMGV